MKINYKQLLPHAGLILGAAAISGGLFILVKSEEAKTRDTIVMQEVISIKQDLYRYYLNNAAYPQTADVGSAYEYIPLGEQGDTPCTASACPRYALRFSLETNLFAPKGIHILTPEELK